MTDRQTRHNGRGIRLFKYLQAPTVAAVTEGELQNFAQEDKNQITQRFQIFHSSEIAGAGTTAGNISWLKIFLDHKQETNIFRFEARTSVTKWQLETGVVSGYRHQQWCRGAAISTQHLYGPLLFCLKRLRHYKGLPFNVNMWTKRLRKRRRQPCFVCFTMKYEVMTGPQKQLRFECLVLDYRQCDSGTQISCWR